MGQRMPGSTRSGSLGVKVRSREAWVLWQGRGGRAGWEPRHLGVRACVRVRVCICPRCLGCVRVSVSQMPPMLYVRVCMCFCACPRYQGGVVTDTPHDVCVCVLDTWILCI